MFMTRLPCPATKGNVKNKFCLASLLFFIDNINMADSQYEPSEIDPQGK